MILTFCIILFGSIVVATWWNTHCLYCT